MRVHLRSLVFLAALLAAAPAWAVRPFVTDDARIIDVGQIELEMWPELVRTGGRSEWGYHLMGGVTVNNWLEIIAGAGVGLGSDGVFAVANPVIQPKLLLLRAEDDGVPGVSIAAGLTLPVGRGHLFDDATGFYLIAPLTSRLFNDWLLIHVNLGFISAKEPGEAVFTRPYWGVGFEQGVFHEDIRLIGEAYAGDPFVALGPTYAFQWGLRWLTSDYVNFDLTFGAQPVVNGNGVGAGPGGPGTGPGVVGNGNGWEFWGQVGIRLLFDTFRKTPGDFMGAPGLWRRAGFD